MGKPTIPFVGAFGFFSLFLFLFVVAANAKQEKVEICHIPPGNPGNAHFITVGASAVPAHVANHGDQVVEGDGTCTAGVGECAVNGFLACTSEGLVCDVEAMEPPEEVEVSCTDGRDNDCDGRIDAVDPDCQVGLCGDSTCAAEVEATLADFCNIDDTMTCSANDDGIAVGGCGLCTIIATPQGTGCITQINCIGSGN